jgi:hypothetical protein
MDVASDHSSLQNMKKKDLNNILRVHLEVKWSGNIYPSFSNWKKNDHDLPKYIQSTILWILGR